MAVILELEGSVSFHSPLPDFLSRVRKTISRPSFLISAMQPVCDQASLLPFLSERTSGAREGEDQ